MMDAAIQASLESARLDTSRNAGTTSAGAGSSKQRPPVNSAAVLRAAAVERRLAEDQDADFSIEELSSGSEESSSEDERPLASKGKGKAKASAAMLKFVDPNESKIMTAAQRRRERQLRRQEQSVLKIAERQLRIKLGRKLTHVGVPVCSCHSSFNILFRRRSPLSLFSFSTQS